jgi:hypothetical protein
VVHIGHPSSSFADGQMLTGAGDFAGKTFQVVTTVLSGVGATGFVGIEVSATVESN